MTDFIDLVVLGIPYGCVFALVGIGLVLAYKTSGVFNLAFGAQAFLSAAVYYDVHVRHDWPIVPATVLAVAVVSPLVGLILDRALFRYLRTAPALARLVTSLGLLVALPWIVLNWLGPGKHYGITGIWSSDWTYGLWGKSTTSDVSYYHFNLFGSHVIDGTQAAILVSTALSVVVLTALFRWSAIGLRMRAVVESPRLSELAGVSSDRVSQFGWALSSAFAGLAGVLIAPHYATLDFQGFTTLLIAAIAAAAFGGLRSIPMTLLGGILLGVTQELLRGYLPQTSVLARNLEPSLPFLALFLLLLFLPSLRRGRDLADPMAGVDPPPPALAAAERGYGFTVMTRVLGIVVVGTVVVLALTRFDAYWLDLFTQGMVYSTIFLSITVITGMAGQVSLSQAAFAGIGAFGTAQLATQLGLPVMLAILIGAMIAAAVGGLLAVPCLRLGGIYLALGTLAFALMFENVIVPLKWVGGNVPPLQVDRPSIGPLDLSGDRAFLLFCMVVFAVVAVFVILVRRGTTGSYLAALRGSEVASESIGINPSRAKVTAFVLSAGIAGLGGGLYASYSHQAQSADYSFFYGLFWVVVVVTLGARTVEGAINAGLGLVLFPELLKFLGFAPSWEFVFFGLGAVTYARHPEGILESQKRASMAFFQRRVDRLSRRRRARGSSDALPEDGVPAPEPAGAEP
ncbi:MAG: ABC transporter permease [Acidimicrobiia bacterium]